MPLSLELAGAGHEVTVASGSDMANRAARLGVSTLQTGPTQLQAGTEMRRRFPGGIDPGPEQSKGVTPFWTEILAPSMVTELMDALADAPPDLIVHDPCVYSAPLVARLLGIPSACHHYSAPGAPVVEYWGKAVEPLWDLWGCPIRPLGGIFDYLVLGLCPPSLWNPDPAKFPTARRIRPMWLNTEGEPGWLATLNDDPTIYVSFGTAFGPAKMFETVLEALGHESLNIVVTVGNGTEPERLGSWPPNVHIEHYIPQSVLLPHCDLVVCHSGSGTMLGAVAHGLPMLCLPLGADHFFNADMCESAGVARVLRPGAVTAESVRSEVLRLLEDQGIG